MLHLPTSDCLVLTGALGKVATPPGVQKDITKPAWGEPARTLRTSQHNCLTVRCKGYDTDLGETTDKGGVSVIGNAKLRVRCLTPSMLTS